MNDDICTVGRDRLGTAVTEAWVAADDQLRADRANYWLNLAFFQGDQWIWWDKSRRQVESLARNSDRDRVRMVANIIRPRINTLMGRMKAKPLIFEVHPPAVDDGSLQGAKISEQILASRHADGGWEELRDDNLFSAFMGGTTLAFPDWDPQDDGDAVVETYNIAEFTLEPGTRRPRDARWMMVARAMPVAQVKDRYGLADMPKGTQSAVGSPLHRRLSSNRGSDTADLALVYQYFQRPDRKGKGGRVATVVDDKVVEYEDWPFPFDHLPGYVFRVDQIPQQWNGDTPITSARPVQVAYNQIRSTILENAKLAGSNRMLIPAGSGLDDHEFTDEPGEVITYFPDGTGSKPSWMEAPSIPRDFRYELERLENEMDDMLYTHATSRGRAVGDRASGLALSILAEKDDTPLSRLARDQQHGWEQIARQVLQMYAKRVTKPRTARTPTDNSQTVTVEWTGKMIAGFDDVHIPSDAVMPYSRAATQSALIEMKQAFPEQFENLPRATFLRVMDLPGAKHLSAVLDDDVDRAVKENLLMSQGEIPIPELWHDHAVHMAEHNRERNSDRYVLADEEVRQVYDLHILAHEMLMRDEVAQQQEANAQQPGIAAMPQANEPVGSLMPRDHIDAGQGPMPAMPAGPAPPR